MKSLTLRIDDETEQAIDFLRREQPGTIPSINQTVCDAVKYCAEQRRLQIFGDPMERTINQTLEGEY
jgi:hypothetical protein